MDDLLAEHRLARPELLGLGGGAGALLPEVARRRRLTWRIPPDAEVISSIGDALSLVRVELERIITRQDAGEVLELHRAAERAALAAGADPESIQVESETDPERRLLRVVAHGAVALPASRRRRPWTQRRRADRRGANRPATLDCERRSDRIISTSPDRTVQRSAT